MNHTFQINLRGIIDLLSDHLYSSPEVFLRELLQNGVDAIRARQAMEPEHQGRVTVSVVQADDGRVELVFEDDGVGLTEDETHKFLATIGASSKREDFAERRNDFIGQFGIGLLSCFMVSDEIVMITRSAKEPGSVVEWRGRADGTYETRRLDPDGQPFGTQVYLSCRPGREHLFEVDEVARLARHYGGMLPFPIEVAARGERQVVNRDQPPWRQGFASQAERRRAYMDLGRRTFGESFFDCIELEDATHGIQGVAYVLPYSPAPGARSTHRVYLKDMLLGEEVQNLLPPWAFFVKCIVNAQNLRPTASRESFYEDQVLEATRELLAEQLRGYLIDLRRNDPQRLQEFIALHFTAIKSIAIHDDEFYELFVDWLPFETSRGRMTLGDYRAQFKRVQYASNVDVFRQISPIASAQGLAIINGGYVYDSEILEKLPRVFPDAQVERVDATDVAESLQELTLDEREEAFDLVKVADLVLQPFKCRAQVRRFAPEELPALFVTSDDATFLRSIEQSKDVANDHWSSILSNLANASQVDTYTQLCFNWSNPLVRKLAKIEQRELMRMSIQMLYVQSLLMGHHPLNSRELALLNTGLLDLIEFSMASLDPTGFLQ